jgi:SAM-dependent methyltransferase
MNRILQFLPFLLPFKRPIIHIRNSLLHFNSGRKSGLHISNLKRTKGKIGLEIGGPSWLWENVVPIYQYAKRIDNFNRSAKTIFGQNHVEGKGRFKYYLFKNGDQYISESGFDLFGDKSYDFILLRDVLEHISNPIKLLIELRRILKPDGTIIISVPNKLGTFDYARDYTLFSHILDDYINNCDENDSTHFQEAKELVHDHREPGYNTREEWSSLVEDNFNTRILHHHVFSEDTICRVISEAGYRVTDLSKHVFPEIIVVAQRYADKNLDNKPTIQNILKYR